VPVIVLDPLTIGNARSTLMEASEQLPPLDELNVHANVPDEFPVVLNVHCGLTLAFCR
jgi:hypothetical protein